MVGRCDVLAFMYGMMCVGGPSLSFLSLGNLFCWVRKGPVRLGEDHEQPTEF